MHKETIPKRNKYKYTYYQNTHILHNHTYTNPHYNRLSQLSRSIGSHKT